MNQISKLLVLAAIAVCFSGCSTTGHFSLPEGSQLYVYDRDEPLQVDQNGKASTTPFFWTAIVGIPYHLEKDGATIKDGRLRARFRVISLFWPPFAEIYWPLGFDSKITYDLVNDTQH